jgi:predicted DNA repair protein MutK
VERAIILALVGIGITALVYGAVGLIVKLDDIGLHLARRGGALAGLGRGLVTGTPRLLDALAGIGTAAMLWVGGGILLHGAEQVGLAPRPMRNTRWPARQSAPPGWRAPARGRR